MSRPTGRTAHLARGMAALAAATMLVAGVPVALWRLAGWPLPSSWPSLAEITATFQDAYVPDEVILGALAVVCWLAWAQLTTAIALEAAAAIRARPAPSIPLGGPAQRLAAHLVAAITLLGEPATPVPPLALPAVELAAPIEWSAPADVPLPAAATTTAVDDAPARVALPAHRVRPREDLWSIAEARLGDPYRWRDIWNLNQGRTMADGRVFTDPDLIHPGWVLDLPADAQPATDQHPAPPGISADDLDDGGAEKAAEPATPSIDAPAGECAPEPSVSPAGNSSDPAIEEDHSPSQGYPEPLVELPSGALVGASLAAGAAAALAAARLHRRRRYQPSAPQPGIRHHDPLRTPLVRALRRAGTPAPPNIEEPPGPDAPPPDHGSGTAAAVAAPREPGAVVVGERDGEAVTIDLLDAGGLAITGDTAHDIARTVLADLLTSFPRLATALITGSELAAALIGQLPDLPGLHVAESGEALTRLEVELIHRARLLETADSPDYRALVDAQPEEPTPLLLVVTGEPVDGRWETILRLGPRLGIVAACLRPPCPLPAVVTGQDGRITAADPPLGHLLGARTAGLKRDDATEILALLTAARGSAGAGDGDETPTSAEEPAVPEAAPGEAVAPVTVELLGPVRIHVGGAAVERGLRTKARELLALLLLHPRGLSMEAAVEALWPEADPKRSVEWFRTVVGNLRSTLRQASGLGHQMFIDRADGGYQADPILIDCDLWRFQRALARAQDASDDSEARQALAAAVAAYTGDLVEASYYEWAEPAREDLRRRALDAATRLAELHERAGDNDAALVALERAIGVDPYAEELYRRTMRLQAACGRSDAVGRTYKYLETRLAELDADPDPATERLLAEVTGRERSGNRTASGGPVR